MGGPERPFGADLAMLRLREIGPAAGTPTQTSNMDCTFLSKQFVGDEITVNFSITKVQRIEDLAELRRTSNSLVCRGLAYIEGSPSTYIRITSVKSSGNYDFEFSQALPEDYDCELLAREFEMKFSNENTSDLGKIIKISNIAVDKGTPPLHCFGNAKFSSRREIPIHYHYDGSEFSFEP